MSDLERRLYTLGAALFGLISLVMSVGLLLGLGDSGQSRGLDIAQGLLLAAAAGVAFWISRRLATGQSLRPPR